MQTADFDHTLFEQGNDEGDKHLLVKFFNKPRENKEKSLEAGHPVFEDICYVDIRAAGKRDPLAVRPATMRDKARFAAHFAAFERRAEAPTEGMPLTEWAAISRSRAEELAFVNVKTVEQLANMADNHVQNFANGFALKQKAKDWLEAAEAKAGDLKFKQLADETKAENDSLKVQIATMMERLNELEAKGSDKDDSKPSRRRRANTED